MKINILRTQSPFLSIVMQKRDADLMKPKIAVWDFAEIRSGAMCHARQIGKHRGRHCQDLVVRALAEDALKQLCKPL